MTRHPCGCLPPCICLNRYPLQVAEQGSHAELLELKGIYWSLVKRQQKGVGPADRDLSPRAKDPPMLSSRDWDYGGESSAALANRWVLCCYKGGG
jgi:hypothetical protein